MTRKLKPLKDKVLQYRKEVQNVKLRPYVLKITLAFICLIVVQYSDHLRL